MPERDEALLPGPTAQQWDGRARIALALAILVIPAAALGVGLGAQPGPLYFTICAAILVLFFAAWLVLGEISLRTMRAEMAAGYSTVLDTTGFALRHPITGALERAADVDPVSPGQVKRSFLLDAFTFRSRDE